MKVSELGEFGLIKRLSQISDSSKGWKGRWGQHIVIGIGDDTAVWRSQGLELATTDTLVQGVHFTLDTTTWRELGWKSLAVNLSDIAAMGGIPAYALVSLALPGDTEVEDVIQLYKGIGEVADRFETVIAGGNISYAPLAVITIALVGVASNNHILTRSAAVPGDLIAVTGYLGSSAAGHYMLSNHLRFDAKTTNFLRNAHLEPFPRVFEGQSLARHGVRAGIDISDGLVADLTHICEMSRVGACIEIEQVPIHPLVKSTFPERCLTFALSGGEDYELLFTANRKTIEGLKEEISCPLTILGEVTTDKVGQVTVLDAKGSPLSIDKKGWDHFVA